MSLINYVTTLCSVDFCPLDVSDDYLMDSLWYHQRDLLLRALTQSFGLSITLSCLKSHKGNRINHKCHQLNSLCPQSFILILECSEMVRLSRINR